tara:strand:+ start:84 stop:479 length:396 start_codon:yes stop_codon:yes gene_type:complete
MATINTLFSLSRLSGTDPLSIRLGPSLTIGDPSGSGSITTTSTTNEVILPLTTALDTYVLITNTGISTSGNVLITNDAGNDPITGVILAGINMGLLKPGDFLFMPLKALTGMKVKYDTASTTLEWFYWTRG